MTTRATNVPEVQHKKCAFSVFIDNKATKQQQQQQNKKQKQKNPLFFEWIKSHPVLYQLNTFNVRQQEQEMFGLH